MASIDSNTSQRFWQQHITQWQESGLSQADYCRQQALHAHQFSYWKCKLLTVDKPVGLESAIGFAQVQVVTPVAASSAPGLSLSLRNDIQVTGITQDTMMLVKQLIEVLR